MEFKKEEEKKSVKEWALIFFPHNLFYHECIAIQLIIELAPNKVPTSFNF